MKQFMKRAGSLFLVLCLIVMQILPVCTVAAGGTPTFIVGGASGAPGERVSVPIFVEDNPGVIGVQLDVYYDSDILTLVGVEDGGILGSAVHSDNLSLCPYRLTWANDLATENYTGNGTVVTLTFAITETCTAESTVVSVGYTKNNFEIFDVDMNEVDFETVGSTISIVVSEACAHESKTEVPSKSPDCTTDGNNAYFVCDSCGVVLAADGITETTVEAETIPAWGHTYQNGFCIDCGEEDPNGPVTSGTCGEDAVWEFDQDSGTLTITGTGTIEMEGGYWFPFWNDVARVVISDGITGIGQMAFSGHGNLSAVEIAGSVTDIAYRAFSNCTSLEAVALPDSLESINADVFLDSAVSEVTFTGDAPEFMEADSAGFGGTFSNITATAFYPGANTTWTEEVLDGDYGGNITWEPYGIAGGMTQDELEAALEEDDYILSTSVTLERNMTIAGNKLTLIGGSLIVPEGITLTVDSQIEVLPGSALDVQGNVDGTGTIMLACSDEGDTAAVNGVPEKMQSIYYDVYSGDNLMGVMEELSAGKFASVEINLYEGVTLSENLTIPKNTVLHMFNSDGITVEENVTVNVRGQLNISAGQVMTNNGLIKITGSLQIGNHGSMCNYGMISVFGRDSKLLVSEGGSLTVEGDLYCNQYGMVEVNGECVLGAEANIKVWHDDGEMISTVKGIPEAAQNLICNVYSEEQLLETLVMAAEGIYQRYDIETYADITLTENAEIPENCYFYMSQNDLTIDEGVELVINGGFGISSISGARTLHNNGTIINNTEFVIFEGSAVQNNGTFIKNGTIENEGTWEGNEAITTGTLTAKSGTVSLEDVIYVNFYYQYADGNLTQEYLEENGGMLIWQKADYPGDEEAVFGHEAAEVSAGLKYVESNGRYMGRTSGLPLRFLNDTLVIVGYVELPDGSYLYAPSKEYSGRIYAENRIGKIDAMADPSQKLIYERDLSIALLNAIAEAQTYFNYNVDDLANSSLSAERKEIQWSSDLLTLAATVDPNKTLERDTAVFTGRSATLSLVGKTEINFYFAIPEATKAAAVDSGILFWTEEDYKNAVTLDSESATYDVEMAYFEANNRWGAAYPVGFASSEYEETVYACAYLVDSDGEFHYSGLVSYSVEQYCYNQIKNNKPEAELSKNLVVYGEAAQTYFH